MRIVVDTNVPVSALVSPFGPSGANVSQMPSARTADLYGV